MNRTFGRVYVERFESSEDIGRKMAEAFTWLGPGLVKTNDRVFIKPNLTFPTYKLGVTTSPEFLEAAVKLLSDTTADITFVESDGGAYAWPAEQAMSGHGIPDLCRRYGAKRMNLTERPRRTVAYEISGREVSMELSAEMLDESDLFITMPVPKVHVMTTVSLGFKNQWGCIPDVMRLCSHPQFNHKVLAINRLLRTRLAIFDGTHFLNRSGPMEGDPVKMNLLIVSDDVGAGSLACCEIMQISPSRAGHLRLAQDTGLMPRTMDDVSVSSDLRQYQGERFRLERSILNWLALGAFRSHVLTHFIYDSKLAKPIHEFLYLFRGRPKQMVPKW